MANEPTKLEKLILMLSSDSDGEVVNAARAIGRLLPTLKLDWHEFARRIGRLEPGAPKTPQYSPGPNQPRYQTDTGPSRFTYSDQPNKPEPISDGCMTGHEAAMLELLHNSYGTKLKGAEGDFITDIYRRHQKYRDKTYLSPRQREWLIDIYERVA